MLRLQAIRLSMIVRYSTVKTGLASLMTKSTPRYELFDRLAHSNRRIPR